MKHLYRWLTYVANAVCFLNLDSRTTTLMAPMCFNKSSTSGLERQTGKCLTSNVSEKAIF